MYPEALVSLLTSPSLLALTAFIVAISTWLCRFLLKRGLSRLGLAALLRGYFVVFLLAIAIGAVNDANAPDSSHASLVFLSYSAVLLLAVFLVPGIALLAVCGRDTIPWSVFLCLAIAGGLTTVYRISWGSQLAGSMWSDWAQIFAMIGGFFTLVTLAFGIAARLRWK